ncbi:MAG: hypothetical protein ACD_72C00101G0003 [uncultured bacterium]|nr:MAG: hypothetical protein ACD_72C00101G0003 [uncultured bacterium]
MKHKHPVYCIMLYRKINKTMKKILLSLFVIFTFGFYTLYQREAAPITVADSNKSTYAAMILKIKALGEDDDDDKIKIMMPASQINTALTSTTSPAFSPASMPMMTQSNGQYKDGTYTGNIVDAYYGNVQVQIIVSGGKLTNINVLDYPQSRDTSRQISSLALPILKQEAIRAQSAQIDAVSGASATSPAFIESLGSALAMAKK